MNQKARKVPPVPSFNKSDLNSSSVPSKQQPPSSSVSQHDPLPTADKKKPNLSSINQKLANMMKSKKDQIDKIKVQNNTNNNTNPKPSVTTNPIDKQKQLYDPAHPNHYQEIKHLYDFSIKQQAKINASASQEQHANNPFLIPSNLPDPIQQEQQPFTQLSQAQQTALKIMQKCGFKIGQGLGKNSQGITTPVVIKKTTDTTCIVTQSNIPMEQIIKPEVSAKIALENLKILTTNVIVLYDIVLVEELNEQSENEIKEECEKYGSVVGWLCYLIDEKVRIFVEYQGKGEGFQAFLHLNERYYAGRLISVRFYGEESWKQGRYGEELHCHISF